MTLDIRDIKRALCVLDERLPQLPGLHWSVAIYSDGSGFINDGLGREVSAFNNDSDILDICRKIQEQ